MFTSSFIQKLISDKLGLEVLRIQENTQGCDQYVWILTTSSLRNQRIVLKRPKNNIHFRIIREVLGCQLLQEIGLFVPHILYWDNEILIETYITGVQIDQIDFKFVSKFDLFFKLGEILKKIHTIPAKGIGHIKSMELVGEFSNLQDYFKVGFSDELQNLKSTGLFSAIDTQKILDYFETNKNLTKRERSVLLHTDYADSNILYTSNNEIALIDFADLSVGYPMQDFAYMYETYYNTPAFDALMEGYQKVDLSQIEFFAFCRFLWLIPLFWKNKVNLDRLQRILQLFTALWKS